MKSTLYTVLAILGISLFCGVIVISIGFGSIFTELNQVSRPIVCGSNNLQVVQQVSHYRPGETSWTISAYCVDVETGVKKDVTLAVQLVTGVIYSLIPLAVIIGFMIKNRTTPEETISTEKVVTARTAENNDLGSVEEKLEKLKELREADLITEADYQKKKDKILDNL